MIDWLTTVETPNWAVLLTMVISLLLGFVSGVGRSMGGDNDS